jgi:hypothetical protein
LRSILRRVRQRALVIEDVAQITAVDPAVTGRTPEEVIGLVLWRIADANAQIFAARDHHLMASKNN